MTSKVTLNAEIIANGPVYAKGPVFVMGMDIKAEIKKLKSEIGSLKDYKPEQIESVIRFLIDKYDFRPEERSSLKSALDTAVKITDWGSRIEFWIRTLKVLSDPFLLHLIITLVKLNLGLNNF